MPSKREARTLENQQEHIDSAEAEGDLGQALELINRALPSATEIGYGVSVCELLHQRGRLLANSTARTGPMSLRKRLKHWKPLSRSQWPANRPHEF